MKIKTQTVRGQTRWVLQTFTNGKRARAFFHSQAEAEEAGKSAQKDLAQSGRWWGGLDEGQRMELAAVAEEVRRAGVTLRAIWDAYRVKPAAAVLVAGLTVKQAINGMLKDKKTANCDQNYLDGLEGFLTRFAKGRETMTVGEILTPESLAEFLGAVKNIGYRKTWKGRLASLVGWCVRHEHLARNPFDKLETIRAPKGKLPVVLEPEQARAAFDVARKWPLFLRYFTLGVMVGLRPEETDQITGEMVRGDWESIQLPPEVSKTRTARTIPIPEPARIWLRLSGEIAQPAMADVTRRRCIRKLREALGFQEWPKDLLRHTAASYLLARTQDLGLVARMLGNSVAVLSKHYINPRTKEEAAVFWALDGSPKCLKDGAKVKANRAAGKVELGDNAVPDGGAQSDLGNAQQAG